MAGVFAECGQKCRSKRHQLHINAAVTKGNLCEVQAYFSLCHSAGQLSDTMGRLPIHVASSCGKLDIVDWLVTEKHVDLGTKDHESGWTALHRAVFYGQIPTARLLLQFSAEVNTRDHEGLGPLDIIMKDKPAYVSYSPTDTNETYTWGDNSNFTLGHSSEQRRSNPEALEVFRKQNISIRDVVMCKYHTVFLTQSGQVYTCGHGHGGRLGHGDEETCVIPRLVEAVKDEVCVQIAASKDHTVLRMESGTLYSFGMNGNHQLGQFPTPASGKSLFPKQINAKNLKGKSIRGICVGRFHTVVYTSEAVFTFGLNAGQLGHPKGTEKQSQPRQVSNLNHKEILIEQVSCSDAATVCLTKKGDIYVLHEYQCRKIASRWQEVKKILVSGGNLDHNNDLDILCEKGGSELLILLLNKSGKVFVWRASSPTLKNCHWAIRRQLIVGDVCLSRSGLGIITDQGEGFLGSFITKKLSSVKETPVKSNQKDEFGMPGQLDLLLMQEEQDVQVHRVSGIHRGLAIMCDTKGWNYTALQATPNVCLTDVPVTSSSTFIQDFTQLLEEVDEYDLVHDVIIQAGGHTWPCHLYILLSRSDHFHKLLAEAKKKASNSDHLVIKIDDIHPDIFDQLLTYMYSDTCDLLHPGTKFDLKPWEYHHHATESSHAKDVESTEILISDQGGESLKKKSAFEVHQLKKKSGGKENRDKGNTAKNKNPIKQLQDAAKKFGIKGLSKRLETVKYVNGSVEQVKVHSTVSRMKFDRQKLRELYDVSIKAEDGTVIHCHKCVLVARLEYFHSMLSSGWVETSDTTCLSLPVPGDILKILIDFLYADDSPVVRESINAEWLCNVLVVADQMLVTRLKEICEVSIAAQVNLKNVAEILEFSFVYNATQLKATCLQFILINLSALLEGRNLEVLSDEVIDEVMKYYRDNIPSMSRRVITPSSEGPSREYLEILVNSINQGNPTTVEHFSKKSKQKKRRSRQKSLSEDVEKIGGFSRERQISVCSDTSIISEDDALDNIVDMLACSPPGNTLQEVAVQNRSTNARKKSGSESIQVKSDDFPKMQESTSEHNVAWPTSSATGVVQQQKISPLGINKGGMWQRASPTAVVSPSSSVSPSVLGSSPGMSLREIMEEENSKLKQHSQAKISKKFSWKEAKKQQILGNVVPRAASQQPAVSDARQSGTATITTPSPKQGCPWGSVNTFVKSFRDLMVEEDTQASIPVKPTSTQPSGSGTKAKPSTISWGLPTSSRTRMSSTSSFDSVTDGIESPKDNRTQENPWIKSKATTPTSSSVSFSDIVKDEQQKTETLAKTSKKPLGLIQIEEQAIQELLQHYHAGEALDEHITVERITQQMATPVWASRQKSRKSFDQI